MLVHNQLITSYIARGGQAVAEAGRQAAGYANIGRAARGMGRDASLAEKQMRAFGTTLRYAFAGSVLFGIGSMVGKLNQLQQQMGLIAAISGPANTNLGGGGLAKLQDQIAISSVDARQSVSDLNASVINYLSTVQNADPKELPKIVSAIGMTARLSQTPVEDLTKAVTTLNIAAGRKNNLENINALLREWFELVSSAPGGISAAPMIAQQLGPLASVAQMGRLTPEQLFGFSQGALRFGATPSVALRGTQYFLQSLFHPPSDRATDVMKGAGLTPELLQKVGGTEFARRYLKHVQTLGATPSRGGVKKFGALADTMMNPDASVGEEFAPNVDIPGLSPKAIEFLSTSLGRIHGIRTALVLLQQLNSRGDVASLDELFKGFEDLRRGVGKGAKQLQNAADKYRAETPLQAAAIALDSMRSQVARDLGFVLDPASRGIAKGAQTLIENDTARKGALITAGAFMTAMVGSQLTGGFGIKKLLGFGGKGIVAAQAAGAISSGRMGLGETPLNPLYVTIVGQIFGGSGGSDTIVDDITKVGFGATIGNILRRGGRGLGKAGVALTAAWVASDWLGEKLGIEKKTNPLSIENWKNSKLSFLWDDSGMDKNIRRAQLSKMKRKFPHLYSAQFGDKEIDPFQKMALDAFLNRQATPTQAEKRLEQLSIKRGWDQIERLMVPVIGASGRPLGTIDGQVDLNIKLTDKDGAVFEKQIPIPLPEWFKGGKGPSTRGRRNTVQMEFTAPQYRK